MSSANVHIAAKILNNENNRPVRSFLFWDKTKTLINVSQKIMITNRMFINCVIGVCVDKDTSFGI